MAFQLANNFGHHLVLGSFAMKENMLFGVYVGDGGSGDDMLGELREEEIVWGEAEAHHQYKDVSSGGDRISGKVGLKINGGDHQVTGRRSMLSRQIEMHRGPPNTWAAGGGTSAINKSGLHTKGAAAHLQGEDCEVEGGRAGRCGGGGEEEGAMRQHIDELIPPHELLARQYAASATTSFSVLHGAGRTLKGMDLRRLRNEVWRQTGFAD